ncbi:MAG: hypothetical protein P8188_03220 [Gemmatimonadota bacterium]
MPLLARALRLPSVALAQLALVALALVGVGATGISAQAADLSGEWVFTVQSPNGTGTRQVTLVQVGDSITGSISSDRATGDLSGSVEGDTVTLRALLMMASGPFEVVYEAEFTDTTMTGTVDFGDYGVGTFTGRKTGGPARPGVVEWTRGEP